jgi:hypothetical protein
MGENLFFYYIQSVEAQRELINAYREAKEKRRRKWEKQEPDYEDNPNN